MKTEEEIQDAFRLLGIDNDEKRKQVLRRMDHMKSQAPKKGDSYILVSELGQKDG